MSEHDQPPFKPGDKFLHKVCGDAILVVHDCFRVGVPSRVCWIVNSTADNSFFADECEKVSDVPQRDPRNEVDELRSQLAERDATIEILKKTFDIDTKRIIERDEQIDDLQRQLDAVKRCHAKDQFTLTLIRNALTPHEAKATHDS